MEEDNSVLGLATIRQNRGISLRQISDSTKISVRSLEAIEKGEFGKLPGGIYDTNYIRQYARAIDYDEGTILAYYQRHKGSGERDTSGPIRNKQDFGGYKPASGILGL